MSNVQTPFTGKSEHALPEIDTDKLRNRMYMNMGIGAIIIFSTLFTLFILASSLRMFVIH